MFNKTPKVGDTIILKADVEGSLYEEEASYLERGAEVEVIEVDDNEVLVSSEIDNGSRYLMDKGYVPLDRLDEFFEGYEWTEDE